LIVLITKSLVKNLGSFEITEKILRLRQLLCFERLVLCSVRVVFHSELIALYEIPGSSCIGRYKMLALQEFTVRNSLVVFEKH